MLQQIIDEAPRFFGYYNVLFLLKALLATFLLSLVGCVLGFILGFTLAVLRRAVGWKLAPLRLSTLVFTEAFRRVPFLVTLMLVFFAFQALRIDTSMFTVALVSVCLIATAFITEIVRAGLDSVHRNQWDAAAAMNLGYLETLRYVVVPQAWKVMLPPAFSFFVLFIKDTALASQIGVVELTFAGKVLANKGFPAALTFGTVLILYFLLSWPLARFGRWMEIKLAPTRTE
ncbi:MAG: amino acid ABC transporter permease [Casimicrobiaceae bacterium]